MSDLENAALDEIGFSTSGSTDVPRRWFRQATQMRREVELIGGALVGNVDLVINYAPPHHLFGALFGEWFPKVFGIPVNHAWKDLLDCPRIDAGSRVFIVCLPMAWTLIERTWQSLRKAHSIVALHSSARLPDTAYEVLRMADGQMQAHEILGSTETGGIAQRHIAPDGRRTPWLGFPDVSFVRPPRPVERGPEELVIASPRIARPAGRAAPPSRCATGDIVRFVGPNTFHMIGRKRSFIKVNGLRVNLSSVERALSKRFPQAGVVVLPMPADTLTGEGYAVFWSRCAARITLSEVRKALEGFPEPSTVMEIPAIPMTVLGKEDRNALIKLLCPTIGTTTQGGFHDAFFCS